MQGKVPVGVTSVAGYTVTLAAVVAAVLAFLKGDRSDQTLGVLASGGMAVLAFLSTQLGRYAQAHAAAKKTPAPKIWHGQYTKDLQEHYAKTLAAGQISAAALATAGEPGEDAPPQASLYPLTDPTTIPPDVGDQEAGSS